MFRYLRVAILVAMDGPQCTRADNCTQKDGLLSEKGPMDPSNSYRRQQPTFQTDRQHRGAGNLASQRLLSFSAQ